MKILNDENPLNRKVNRELLPFEIAFETAIGYAKFIGSETVSLQDSLGRILTEDVISDVDMPPFNRAAMDGYACRYADIGNELTIIEEVPAGTVPQQEIGENQCAKIMTGAIVPEGADTVIMVEQTQKVGENKIRFIGKDTVSNIAKKGEDVEMGDTVLRRGMLIYPQHIGILAALGKVKVSVAKKPIAAIIATGDEIVEPDEKPTLSQTRNVNSYELMAKIEQVGAEYKYYGLIGDDFEKIDKVFKTALAECDLVIITGGVSMGDYDIVPQIFRKNGVEILFDRIAIKPGRPTTFGVTADKVIWGLPGNPVSTLISFELFVKPFLFKMMGHNYNPIKISLPLEQTVSRSKTARASWIPVKITDSGKIRTIKYNGSGHIASFVDADGVICIPRGVAKIEKDSLVDVRLFVCH